jgi:DNA end-binding protein Ku
LAQKLIESKSSTLNLASFADRYQAAVLDLIKAKVDGTTPVLVPRSEVGQVINLMDALRQSVEQATKKPEPVRNNGRKKVALAA